MRTQLEGLAKRYSLSAVYAFGSRAAEISGRLRGDPVTLDRPEADLDIAVQPYPSRRVPAAARAQLAAELEDLFGVPRADLVVLSEADAFLALDIIRGELLYCADADDEAEYELYVLRRADDLAPFARDRWETILKGNAS